jgi:DNA (cytosine-5)-methyltransferase 1
MNNPKHKKKYNYIDIFAGCGGISLGLYNAGWKGLFAIEKDPLAFKTLKHNLMDKKNHFNWPKWLSVSCHDINKVLEKHSKDLKKLRGNIDLVVGGPPCQGFSMAGRRNEKDERNKMIDAYIKFIKLVKPNSLFFENVKGFTIGFKNKKYRGEAYSNYVLRELNKIGYNVEGKIIDFSEFGIPQRRKRFILIGLRKDQEKKPKDFFNILFQDKIKFLKKKGLKSNINVKDAISDLERKNGEIDSVNFKLFKEGLYSKPKTNYQKLLRKNKDRIPDSHRFAKHNDSTINKFKYVLKNCKKNINLDKKTREKFGLKKKCVIPLCPKKVSPTLTTLPDDYIHYSEPRILTVREYARIQSFNDWFEFKGKYTTGGKLRKKEVPRYTQVGNAIPPLFGEQSGGVLIKILR